MDIFKIRDEIIKSKFPGICWISLIFAIFMLLLRKFDILDGYHQLNNFIDQKKRVEIVKQCGFEFDEKDFYIFYALNSDLVILYLFVLLLFYINIVLSMLIRNSKTDIVEKRFVYILIIFCFLYGWHFFFLWGLNCGSKIIYTEGLFLGVFFRELSFLIYFTSLGYICYGMSIISVNAIRRGG